MQQTQIENEEPYLPVITKLFNKSPSKERLRTFSVTSIECLRKPKISGVAYGTSSTLQSIGLAIYPFIYGWINKEPSKDSYNKSLMLLILKSIIGSIMLLIVYIRDMNGRRVLHTPVHLQEAKNGN